MGKNKIDIQCAVGPPCTYLTIGNAWGCSFDGLCQYQRPLRFNVVLTPVEADTQTASDPACGRYCTECGKNLINCTCKHID